MIIHNVKVYPSKIYLPKNKEFRPKKEYLKTLKPIATRKCSEMFLNIISKSKFLDSLIIESLSNPTIRVIFVLMLPAVLQIISYSQAQSRAWPLCI